jgi:hypothetical protein
MKLTTEQITFFNTFGYLGIPALFTEDEVAKIIEGFEWSIQNNGGGTEHDGSKRTMFGGPIEHTPEMCSILDHPSILGLIGGVIAVATATITPAIPVGTRTEAGDSFLP